MLPRNCANGFLSPLLHAVQRHRVDGFRRRLTTSRGADGTKVVSDIEVDLPTSIQQDATARQIFFRCDECKSVDQTILERCLCSKSAARQGGQALARSRHNCSCKRYDRGAAGSAARRQPLARKYGPQRTPSRAILRGRRLWRLSNSWGHPVVVIDESNPAVGLSFAVPFLVAQQRRLPNLARFAGRAS